MPTPHDAPTPANTPNPADRAEQLYKDYLAGGPDAAYKSLKADYDASAGMCHRDEYWQNVASDLQASGHMPNISVGWLKAEKANLDTNNDGVIEAGEVKAARNAGGLNAMLADQILTSVPSPGDNKTFFDQIAHTKKAWTDSPDGIEDADLRKYSRQMHRAERREYNHNEVAQAADPLLANNEELARFLDQRKDGTAGNGFISRHEMKTFLKEYKEHPGEGLYTAENAEFVNEVLHGEVARIHNPPFHGFGIANLERRAGVTTGDIASAPQPLDTPLQATKTAQTEPCDVPAVKAPAAETAVEKCADQPPSTPAKPTTDCAESRLYQWIDSKARLNPSEGYNAVAAKLLGIDKHTPRSPEMVKEITVLGRQIAEKNEFYSTYHLRTNVVLPVASNLQWLKDHNPQFKAAMDTKLASFEQ